MHLGLAGHYFKRSTNKNFLYFYQLTLNLQSSLYSINYRNRFPYYNFQPWIVIQSNRETCRFMDIKWVVSRQSLLTSHKGSSTRPIHRARPSSSSISHNAASATNPTNSPSLFHSFLVYSPKVRSFKCKI